MCINCRPDSQFRSRGSIATGKCRTLAKSSAWTHGYTICGQFVFWPIAVLQRCLPPFQIRSKLQHLTFIYCPSAVHPPRSLAEFGSEVVDWLRIKSGFSPLISAFVCSCLAFITDISHELRSAQPFHRLASLGVSIPRDKTVHAARKRGRKSPPSTVLLWGCPYKHASLGDWRTSTPRCQLARERRNVFTAKTASSTLGCPVSAPPASRFSRFDSRSVYSPNFGTVRPPPPFIRKMK